MLIKEENVGDASIELLLGIASFGFTTYFWLVQARREKPRLRFYQIGDFRGISRKHQGRDDCKRLCLSQRDGYGVLIANNSTRQNSIVLFDCWLLLPDGSEIRGDWGTVGEDRPPWNIGPESSISFSLACFFDVPVDFELPQSYSLGVQFITASGQRFCHKFLPASPQLSEDATSFSRAA